MARRRRTAPLRGDGDLILPLHLVDDRPTSAAEYQQQWRAKRQWFIERGVNWRDWSEVYPILQASWKAHGITDRLDRLKVVDLDLMRQHLKEE